VSAATATFVTPQWPRGAKPRTTVICAVWHRDPDRHDFLRGHQANLDKQSQPVERVYVFDGNDIPPNDLKGHKIVSREPLTIYQAWNIALAAVHTAYVMNLNLDDRLCTDAVEKLEDIADTGSDLVGGDWRNCFSIEEVDGVGPCDPKDALPPAKQWPPEPGLATRLGNSDHNHVSMGHACLWRMDLHRTLSRYPMQFSDGSPICSAGDSIWWGSLVKAEKKLTVAPLIVGHYFSRPSEQAQFRNKHMAEIERARREGLSTRFRVGNVFGK